MDKNINININIQDIHYNKYIKYKTKYLELKELSGGITPGGITPGRITPKTPVASTAPVAYTATDIIKIKLDDLLKQIKNINHFIYNDSFICNTLISELKIAYHSYLLLLESKFLLFLDKYKTDDKNNLITNAKAEYDKINITDKEVRDLKVNNIFLKLEELIKINISEIIKLYKTSKDIDDNKYTIEYYIDKIKNLIDNEMKESLLELRNRDSLKNIFQTYLDNIYRFKNLESIDIISEKLRNRFKPLPKKF